RLRRATLDARHLVWIGRRFGWNDAGIGPIGRVRPLEVRAAVGPQHSPRLAELPAPAANNLVPSSAPSDRPTARTGADSADPALPRLSEAIERAAHLLPAQGPITVFIHHNTLHAFEDLPFTEAVVQGGRLFGCQPYLPEDRYREKMARGRIRIADL